MHQIEIASRSPSREDVATCSSPIERFLSSAPWGLHSESLGVEGGDSSGRRGHREPRPSAESDWAPTSRPRQRPRGGGHGSSSASPISSPRLVAGMLPENGGGLAAAVSASESHTAVVTADGRLFTWGASDGRDVLGHRGVRYQPMPRRVERVHRAVAVAAAREHTVLLAGTSLPPLPRSLERPPTLTELAALETSRNVDLFNVLPVALVARRLDCRPLVRFCESFVRRNLDGVLAVGNKNDFAAFLSSVTIVGSSGEHRMDDAFHPFLYRVAYDEGWFYAGRTLLKQYAGTVVPRAKKIKRSKEAEQQPCSTMKEKKKREERENDQTNAVEPIKEVSAVGLKKEFAVKDSSSKVTRSKDPQPRPVPAKLFQDGSAKPPGAKVPTSGKVPAPNKYCCDICGISCPDGDSYTLHVNGRKHRNRLMHARAEEEKSVAESMMATKRMQLMGGNGSARREHATPRREQSSDGPKTSIWGTPNAASKSPSSNRKARSKSFQDILNEDQERARPVVDPGENTSPASRAKPPVALGGTPKARAPTLSKSPPTAAPKKKKSAPASSPGSSVPLSAFLKKGGGGEMRSIATSAGASWGARPSNCSRATSWGADRTSDASHEAARPSSRASSTAKSFSEIQREEEAIRGNEDKVCRIDGNRWYVRRRERAASIGEIQEQERRDREMNDLIEEQRQIEAEIAARARKEEEAKGKEKDVTAPREERQRRGKKKKGKEKRARDNVKPETDLMVATS